MTVAVTGSRRAMELAHIVRSHGGSPYIAPTVGIALNAGLEDEVKRFCEALRDGRACVAIFMTGPGVFSLFAAARSLGRVEEIVGALSRIQVVARGSKPKHALSKHGVRVDLVPVEATSQGILHLVEKLGVRQRIVLVLSHGSDSSYLCDGLRALGAEVVEFSGYSYSLETDSSGARLLDSMTFSPVMPQKPRVAQLIGDIVGGKVDAITFTSPPSAHNLFAVAAETQTLESLQSALNSRVVVAAVGAPTRAAVEESGVGVDVMPSVYRMGPMVKALCDYVKGHGTKGRDRSQSSESSEGQA